MLPNNKLGCLLLSEKYLYFNVWSFFLVCPCNKEPYSKSSDIIVAKQQQSMVVKLTPHNQEITSFNPGGCRTLSSPTSSFRAFQCQGVYLSSDVKTRRTSVCKFQKAYIGSQLSGYGGLIHFKQVCGFSCLIHFQVYPALPSHLSHDNVALLLSKLTRLEGQKLILCGSIRFQCECNYKSSQV